MPTASPKPCRRAGCPQLVSHGFCPEHARPTPEDKAEQNAKDKRWIRTGRTFYNSARWGGLRRAVLRANPWCAELGCQNLATDVDHVVPLRDGGDPTALSNLQPLCHMHHSAKTAREVWGRK